MKKIPHNDEEESVTLARLERALMTVAHVVMQHGDRYAPIFERLERELAAARERSATVDRARAVLERYTVEGGAFKPIR
jgi:hypothetical protein